MRLVSTTGGRDTFLADDDPSWQGMVQSGQWKVADGETVSMVDEYGQQTVVDAAVQQADAARGIGGTIEDQATVTQRARSKRLEDQTSTAGSFARGLGSGVSFGITDEFFDPETIEADQLHHGTARFAGEAVGVGATLVLGNDLGLAKLGGRLLGDGAAAAKVSAGARELAVTREALAAEQVGSTISSKALLAGKADATVAERTLARTGRTLDEATVAREGLENVPQDLIGLDAAGLRKAAAEERAALKAEANLERESLENLRKPQREEIVNQVREVHEEMATSRPIFKAVTGADVKAIPGVKDASVQLAKSYKGLRSTLDKTIAVSDNPELVVGHLQMRQQALESLQELSPKIQSVLGSDARAEGLLHVDTMLEQTRAQIDTIRSLSRRNPVKGVRLAELEAGLSPRLTAIEAAQEAIKNAPEMGLAERGVRAGVFAGATALAHAIPGVGVAAPFVGKWASENVGRVFERFAEARAAVGKRSKQALDAFLDVTTRRPAALATAGARTATAVLREARFAPGEEPKGRSLPEVYKARSAEIRSQTMYDPTGQVVMRPEARQAIAKRLAPIAAVNPLLADQLETIAVRKAEFISSKLPRQPELGGIQIGPDNWQPSDLEMRSWARTVRAVEDPGSVEERLVTGDITPEDAEAYRTVYPERFAMLQADILAAVPSLSKTLPLKRKVAMSIFAGVPLIPALQPNVLQVLQGNFRTESGGGTQPNAPAPNFGALGSAKSIEKPTSAQQREGA